MQQSLHNLMLKLRATWITSLLAGLFFGTSIQLLDPPSNSPFSFLLIIAFAAMVVISVVGIPQLRELHQEQRENGGEWFGMHTQGYDFWGFHGPAMGRGCLFFCAVTVSTLIAKRILA